MTPNTSFTENTAASELDKGMAMVYDEMDELVATATLFNGKDLLAGGIGFKDSAGNNILVNFQDADRGRILAKVNHRDWTLLPLLKHNEYHTVLDALRWFMATYYLATNANTLQNCLPADPTDQHFHVRNV